MNKGKALERQIDSLCAYVNALGFHAHKNHPLRTAEGTYLEGEPYDYELFLVCGGKPYHACFDAKECADLTWRMKPKDIKQAAHLKHCKNAGIDAFFLVYFVPIGTLLKIDVDEILRILQAGHKAVPSTVGTPWNINDILKEIRKEGGA